MSFLKNISTKWIIGVLVALNIALLSFILFMRPSSSIDAPAHERSSRKTSKFLQKELNLSDAEAEVFRALQKEHFKAKKEQYKKIKVLRKEMLDALNLETPDASKAQIIAEQIGKEYQVKEEMMLNHYLELKAKCTSPEQQQKLEQVFKRIITNKNSHGRKHGKDSGKGCK